MPARDPERTPLILDRHGTFSYTASSTRDGVFSDSSDSYNTQVGADGFRQRYFHTSRPPYFVPLPYTVTGVRELSRAGATVHQKRQQSKWVSGYGTNVTTYTYDCTSDLHDLPHHRAQDCYDPDIENLLIGYGIASASNKAIDLALAMWEIKSTFSMFNNRVKTLAKAIDQIKRGKFQRAAETLSIAKPSSVKAVKGYANNFLEYQFGWTPLVNDVIGGAKFLAERLQTIAVVTGHASYPAEKGVFDEKTTSTQWTTSLWPPMSGNSYWYKWNVTSKIERHIKDKHVFSICYGLDSRFVYELNKLGLMSPLTTVFNAIPYSFIAGWISNIQNIVDSYSLPQGLKYIGASYTTLQRMTEVITPYSGNYIKGNGDLVEKSFDFRPGLVESWACHRKVYPNQPVPALQFYLPSSYDVSGFGTGASLVAQKMPNGSRR